MKRIVCLLTAVLMLICCCACGSGTAVAETETAIATEAETQQTASEKSTEDTDTEAATETETEAETVSEEVIADSVTIGITTAPENLSPIAVNNEGNVPIRRSFYEPLMELVNGEYCMVLMESYEKIDDLTYDVKIRENIYDQAGNHMTASDVTFIYNKYRELNPNSLGSLDHVETIDEYTSRIYINEANFSVGSFEGICSEFFCVTEAAYNASADAMVSSPVGTGRYKMVSYVPGSTVVATLSDSYWNEDGEVATLSQGNVKNITWTIIPEAAQISIALETGAIDGSTAVAEADMVNFVNDDGTAKEGFNIAKGVDKHIYDLQFNSRDRQCADQKVRQAIAYAIDSEAIGKAAFGDLAVVLYQEGIKSCPDYDYEKYASEDSYYKYDVDKAKELLKEAGYENGGFTLDLICADASYYSTMAQLIQAYLAKVGITVNIHQYETATLRTFVDTAAGEWDLYLNAHYCANVYLANAMMNQLSTSTSYGLSFAMIKDDKLDELLGIAQNPKTAGVDATSEAIEYLADQCYLYGITGLSKQVITTSKITNVVFNNGGFIMPGACTYSAK